MADVLKKLSELQLGLRDNGGSKIQDLATVQEGDYGYVFALTTCHGNVHDELLFTKLAELKGKQLMPDLWMFGPCVKDQKDA